MSRISFASLKSLLPIYPSINYCRLKIWIPSYVGFYKAFKKKYGCSPTKHLKIESGSYGILKIKDNKLTALLALFIDTKQNVILYS